jgi:PilZ domain
MDRRDWWCQGLGTDLSRNGMALYAGLMLKVGDPIEVEFQIPSRLRVVCIIRNRGGYCFGLEFLAVLPS